MKGLLDIAREAALFNANALAIHLPQIHIAAPGDLMTSTTIAAMSSDGRHLAIRNTVTDERTIWFAVSHEMRHAWQIENRTDFSSYRTADESGKEEYNEQESEIDAHAWSYIVLQSVFGIRPKLEDVLGKEYVSKILKQERKILESMSHS